MALSEFVAIENAYRALQPLDPAARRRALQWLNDALGLPDLLPTSVAAPAVTEPLTPEVVAEVVEALVEVVEDEPVVVVVAAGDLDTEAVGSTAEPAAEAPVTEGSAEPVTEESVVAEPAQPAPARSRAGRRAAASAAAGRRGRKATKAAKPAKPAAADADSDRVYRRRPPAEDVLRAYEQVGTISGLAEFYGVPRHTVQGWARRMRRDGHVIGRGGADAS